MRSLRLDASFRDLAGLAAGELAGACLHRLQFVVRLAAGLMETLADDVATPVADIRPADPARAIDIYGGVFAFAGHVEDCRGRNVFMLAATPAPWARALHGFGWLGDLAALGTPAARLNAQALVDDWLALDEINALADLAWEPGVAAERLSRFIAHAGFLRERAGLAFGDRFLASVTRHFHRLRQGWGGATGLPRLQIAAALLAASIAVPRFRRYQAAAMRRLDEELARQILTDGGHVSRNPQAIGEVLAEILPLRAALAFDGKPASATMMTSIDRMMPMLRFFRLGSGDLAHFNGSGDSRRGLVEAVLAHDDADGRSHGNAPHSGFQRLEAGDTIVVMDCGPAPAPSQAGLAHAGALSFEFTSGKSRLIVNCGADIDLAPEWRAAARATAAHSTLTVADRSSARVVETGFLAWLMGPTLIGGPTHVAVDRQEHAGDVAIVASHDGYRAGFGLIHERTLRLGRDGDRIDGRDRLVDAPVPDGRNEPAATAPCRYDVRFHLHPSITVTQLANGVVLLMAEDGDVWEFHADDCVPVVEDSVYLADPAGPRPTRQIVLAGDRQSCAEQRWTLVRTAHTRR